MKGVFRCEWCGDFRGGNHREHCPDNPRVREATAAALDDGHGFIRLSNDYKKHMRGGMAYSTLWKKYGTWANVAHAFGLQIPDTYKPRPEKAKPPSELDRAVAATWDEMEAEIKRNQELRFGSFAFRM